MSHQEAKDLVNRARNTLSLRIQRNIGQGESLFPNVSAYCFISVPPSVSSSIDDQINKQSMSVNASSPGITVARGVIPHIEPNNALLPSEQEKRMFAIEKSKERQAVINQVI